MSIHFFYINIVVLLLGFNFIISSISVPASVLCIRVRTPQQFYARVYTFLCFEDQICLFIYFFLINPVYVQQIYITLLIALQFLKCFIVVERFDCRLYLFFNFWPSICSPVFKVPKYLKFSLAQVCKIQFVHFDTLSVYPMS